MQGLSKIIKLAKDKKAQEEQQKYQEQFLEKLRKSIKEEKEQQIQETSAESEKKENKVYDLSNYFSSDQKKEDQQENEENPQEEEQKNIFDYVSVVSKNIDHYLEEIEKESQKKSDQEEKVQQEENLESKEQKIENSDQDFEENKKKIEFLGRSRLSLRPSYMKNFRCIGSICEDTCCVGWKIEIDYPTYQKYKSCKDEVLEPLFKNYVKRLRGKSSKKSPAYAAFKDTNQNKCSFLEDSLCLIQKRMGEEWLCNTCYDYPRVFNKVDRYLESSLNLSCPEAARLILLNKDLMSFDEDEVPVQTRGFVSRSLSTKNIAPNADRRISQFWLVREFLISLLQNREYTIEMRLMLMGKFTELMEEFKSKKESEFISMVHDFHSQVENKDLYEHLLNLPTNYDFQAQMMIEIMEDNISTKGGLLRQRYLDILAPVLQGLKYGYETDLVVRNYKNVLLEKYQPFMQEHSYIFENYFVNHVFKELYPFKGRAYFDEFVRLITNYCVVRLHLVGLSAMDELSLDNIVYIFQVISRMIEHNSTFVNKIGRKIADSGFRTSAHLITLINN